MLDLPECGADVYWHHILTEILCLVYTVDGASYVWRPGDPIDHLAALACDPNVIFVSHGPFEQIGWAAKMVPEYGFPPLSIERWHDTMAACAWQAKPLALEKLAPAIRLPIEKDTEGRKHTLDMSKPMTKAGAARSGIVYQPGTLDRSPAAINRTIVYCRRDVDVEAMAHGRLGYPSAYERRVWELDQKINQRGVRIDQAFVRKAIEVVEKASRRLAAEFEILTGGLAPTQRDKLIGWCASQGVRLDNLQKEYLSRLLGGSIDDDPDELPAAEDYGLVPEEGDALPCLPDGVRRALQIRQTLGSASIAKLPRMLACCGAGSRARYILQYHAAGTGRWGGRLFQPQNFPRGSLRLGAAPVAGEQDKRKAPPVDMVVAAIMSGSPDVVEMILGAPAIECVVSSLRHAIVAEPGNVLLSGDFAGIEMRIVLALAGQYDKTELLATGKDVYIDMAGQIYRRPVSKDDIAERTIGKNTVLGCGFGMGHKTFRARYCKDQTPEFAKGVIDAYRKQWAPKVPDLWKGLERAALEAVQTGRETHSYGITYKKSQGALHALLPSGQILWYNEPALTSRAMPWDATDVRLSWKYRAFKQGQWKEIHAWGGLLTENVVQALARGLLVDSMYRLEREGFPLVMTVHDEDVSEVPRARADEEAFKQIMAEVPAWAAPIRVPVNVEGWQGERYRK